MTIQDELIKALDLIHIRVSYVILHGVGEQPESNGLPQLVRVSPAEFARLFQEIGKIAADALAKAETGRPQASMTETGR